MCVKTAINARLKKLIAQLTRLKKLIAWQLYWTSILGYTKAFVGNLWEIWHNKCKVRTDSQNSWRYFDQTWYVVTTWRPRHLHTFWRSKVKITVTLIGMGKHIYRVPSIFDSIFILCLCMLVVMVIIITTTTILVFRIFIIIVVIVIIIRTKKNSQ